MLYVNARNFQRFDVIQEENWSGFVLITSREALVANVSKEVPPKNVATKNNDRRIKKCDHGISLLEAKEANIFWHRCSVRKA